LISTSIQNGRTAFDVAKDPATVTLLQEVNERLQQRERLLRNAYGVNDNVDVDDGAHEEGSEGEVGNAMKKQKRDDDC
jgi:hypothetical protein